MTPDELLAAVAKVEQLGWRIRERVEAWRAKIGGVSDVVDVTAPEVIALAALTRGWLRAGCPDADGWVATRVRLPPPGVAVETKVDDAEGVRNVATLRRSGSLWFLDGGVYTHYTPTHWRKLDPAEAVAAERERWAAEARQRAETAQRHAGDARKDGDDQVAAIFCHTAGALDMLAADLTRPGG